MEEEDFNLPDPEPVAERFERMIQAREELFFETGELAILIDHYVDKKEIQRALQVARVAVSQYPFRAWFYVKLAQVYFLLNNLPEMSAALDKATALEPSETHIYLTRGTALISQNDLSGAKEQFNKAIAYAETEGEIQFQVAVAYMHYNLLKQAKPHLIKTLELDPQNVDALDDLAFCFSILGQKQESVEFFRKQTDREPYSYEAWYHLGSAYFNSNQLHKAVDAYDYAILIKKDYLPAYYNKGDILIQLENYKEGLEVYKSMLEFDPEDPEIVCAIAECYEGLKLFPQAREYYTQASLLDPEDGNALYGIGSTYLAESQYLQAEYYFKKALEMNDESPNFWFALGDVNVTQGNYTMAELCYQRVLELDPFDIDAWLDYSSCLIQHDELGDREQSIQRAIEALNRGVLENPEAADLYYRLTVYHSVLGHHPLAVQNFEIALNLNPDNYDVIFEYLPVLKENATFLNILRQYKL